MKQFDIKSAIIGALAVLLVLVSMGAATSTSDLGDITVASLSLVNEDGSIIGLLRANDDGGAALALWGQSGQSKVSVGCIDDGCTFSLASGRTHPSDVRISSSASEGGLLSMHNWDDSLSVAITNGAITTFNEQGYSTMTLGTMSNGKGDLRIYNDFGEQVVVLGTNNSDAGAALFLQHGTRIGGFDFLPGYGGAFLTGCNGNLTGLWGTNMAGGGYISLFDSSGVEAFGCGVGSAGGGYCSTMNGQGNDTGFFGTGEDGEGYLRTYNIQGNPTGFFGTSDHDGVAILVDRYGDIGWSRDSRE